MSEIDEVLAESMRRRAAEARLGGGSMADVQQRVVRRRRRGATAACAVLILPALVGVGVVIGQHSSRSNINAGAESGPPSTTVASPGAPCTASFPAGVTPTPCAMGSIVTASCASGGGGSTVSLGAPEAAPPAPPDSTNVVTPDTAPLGTGPTNTYPVIIPSPVACAMPVCAAVALSGSAGAATVSGQAPTAPSVETTGTLVSATPAEPVSTSAGSVPPDAGSSVAGTKVVDVTVAGPNSCGSPTSWMCTGEITTSSTWPGVREFAQCQPVFRYEISSSASSTVEAGTVVATPTP